MPIPLGVLAVAGAGASGGGTFDLLETTLITTNTASVTFSSLGSYSAYKHLQIRMTVRGASGTFPEFKLRFNGQSSTYAYHHIRGFGSAVNSSGTTGNDYLRIGSAPNTATTSAYYALVIDILDFSNTNKNKVLRALGGYTADGYDDVRLQSGLWVSTNAITSIGLFADVNIASGSRFSLYGIR